MNFKKKLILSNSRNDFEKLVRLIHESLRSDENTKISSNIRLRNKGGQYREIDILIETKVNNLDIAIAIECKDNKNPIPVKEIEAFNSKCLRIPGINKKLFVSSNGFQKDAHNAANDFDIDLYSLNEISHDDILNRLVINQLKQQYDFCPPFNLKIKATQDEADKIPHDKKLIIHTDESSQVIELKGFVWNNVVVKHQNEIRSCLYYDFVKRKQGEPINKKTIIPFTLNPHGAYFLNEKGNKIYLTEINSVIETWFEEHPLLILGKSYSKINGITEAKIFSTNIGKNQHTDIVIDEKEELKIFHTKEDGIIYPLDVLLTYDSNSDTFEYPNQLN